MGIGGAGKTATASAAELANAEWGHDGEEPYRQAPDGLPDTQGFRKMCWDGRNTGAATYGSVVGGLLQQRMDALLKESPAMDEFLPDDPKGFLDLAVLLLQLASHFENEPALYRGGSTSNALHHRGCNYAQRQMQARDAAPSLQDRRRGKPEPRQSMRARSPCQIAALPRRPTHVDAEVSAASWRDGRSSRTAGVAGRPATVGHGEDF